MLKLENYDRIVSIGLLEVVMSSPQGDPATGNRPRTDLHTQQGLITRASFTRDIRDQLKARNHEIFLVRGTTIEDARKSIIGSDEKGKKEKLRTDAENQKLFIEKYTDAIFGAVLETSQDFKIPNIRGWVRLSHAISVSPIEVTEMPGANTTSNYEKGANTEGRVRENKEFGFQTEVVRYGVYKFSAVFDLREARAYGLSEKKIKDIVDTVRECLLDLYQSRLSGTKQTIGLRRMDAFFSKGPALNVAEIYDLVRVEQPDPDSPPPSHFNDYSVLLPSSEDLKANGIEHEVWKEDVLARMTFKAA